MCSHLYNYMWCTYSWRYIIFKHSFIHIYILCVSSFSSQKWVSLLLMLLMLFVREKKWMNSSTAYVCVCAPICACAHSQACLRVGGG